MEKIYLFKVALKYEKRIWRRIAVRDEQTLHDFHDAIFNAFDRYDEHLYSFYLTKSQGRSRSRLRNVPVYTHPSHFDSESFFTDDYEYNAAHTVIKDLRLKEKQKLEYLFDFGDEWWHEITVEKIEGLSDVGNYPKLLKNVVNRPLSTQTMTRRKLSQT